MTKPFCGVLRSFGLQTFTAQDHTKPSLTTKHILMKTSKQIVVLLLLLVCSIANYSYSDDTSECEMSNQGTVILDNTRNDGTLFVFFNDSGDLKRGTQTIRIDPNKTGSVDYPAGPIKVKAYVVFNTLNIGDLVEKDINLESCEKTTIVY